MATTPPTSASMSSQAPTMSQAFTRIYGPTDTSTATAARGPQMKSKFQSLLERRLAERDVDEALNPWKKLQREMGEKYSAEKSAEAESFLRSNSPTTLAGKQAMWTPELMGRYGAKQDIMNQRNAAAEAKAREYAMWQARSGGGI
jgi:hypothetical protein